MGWNEASFPHRELPGKIIEKVWFCRLRIGETMKNICREMGVGVFPFPFFYVIMAIAGGVCFERCNSNEK